MSLLLLFGSGAPAVTRLTISVSPDPPQLNTPVTVTALLLDENGDPMVGRTIYFEVTGANTANGTDTTDVDGEAILIYTPTSTGTDVIKATWGDPDGLDLVYADTASTPDHIYRLDGFSTTVVDDFSVAFIPSGIGYDGDNLLTCAADGTVRRHDGISATVTDSLAFSLGDDPNGVTWTKEGNLVVATDEDIFVCDGWSTTVLSSFPSPYGFIVDIGYDGDNLLISTENTPIDSQSFRMVGATSTVDTSFQDGTGGATRARGIAWDGTDVLIARGDGVGGITDEIKKGTGFNTPYQASLLQSSTNPVGLIWTAALYAEEIVSVSVYGSGYLGRRTARLVP